MLGILSKNLVRNCLDIYILPFLIIYLGIATTDIFHFQAQLIQNLISEQQIFMCMP